MRIDDQTYHGQAEYNFQFLVDCKAAGDSKQDSIWTK